MKKTALSLSMLMLAVFLLVAPAYADTLNLSLASPIQTGTPNGTLTFNATASAPSANSATIFLNGDNFNVSLAGATIGDTDFLLNFPLSLDPGNSFTGDLFAVSLPSILIPGTYNGFFEILGGADPAAESVLATVNFQVNALAPVPEPGTWLLLTTGLPLLAMWGIQTIECPIHAHFVHGWESWIQIGKPTVAKCSGVAFSSPSQVPGTIPDCSPIFWGISRAAVNTSG